MFNPWCFLHELIHKTYNTARYKEGTEIANYYKYKNDEDETQSIILDMRLAF
jgi:hypothetical protein